MSCSICQRPDAEAVNTALRRGDGLGTVAKATGLSKATLGRHRAGCLGGASHPTETGVSPPSETPPATPARIESQNNFAETSGAVLPPRDGGSQRGETGGLSEVDDIEARPASREERVRAVMGLMASLRWETGRTGPLLAARWGMSVDGLKDIAAEASRRLKAVVDPVRVREKLAAALDEVAEMAVAKGDAKGLAALTKAFADLTGAGAPKKHELTGADGAPLGLPPRAALLLERAKAGDGVATKLLEVWLLGSEDDAPALPPAPETVQ